MQIPTIRKQTALINDIGVITTFSFLLGEKKFKKVFPKKTLEVTDRGLEFIEMNKYVLYYDQTSQFRSLII